MNGEGQLECKLDQKCSILLVEDSVINQKLMVLMLRRYGIVPVVAPSGYEAVDAVESGEFDLVLMDLNMPGMDGIQAAGEIRSKLGDDCPPIIALTADIVFKIDEEMACKGFKAILTKPITPDSLTKCIQHHTTFQISKP